ncbi:MAG: hypothetical protein A2X25_05350 [Chloroflexi bacterium GWB2_49_20]|nr:MAG: hypothetical protein A2X25_05350 [Chloroflexi bacterium GWB2_49_20]OGN77054.1 MAG: hypothetical protein A2X26_06355 [Chloroflexi bacterium GWC2_49_37]OGN83779.1 MAG: hypothetical protein A2X27_01950 [Chloroflexi bacterium GWD2_49_16]HCM96855.1 SCO1664 family protein [Anaerolineae bacterium]
MDTASLLADETIQEILLHGEIELQGQFVLGYNYTFLVQVSAQNNSIQAVYKPRRGEQPLWDFPADSLSKREVAAYLVSQASGWDLVPVTVLRETGPFGPGSLQSYIEHDSEIHYFNFSVETKSHLRPVALFDLLINNADRKGGHLLLDADQRVWLIDHGLCFHEEEKLRTVIWDFAGQIIPNELLAALAKVKSALDDRDGLFGALASHLSLAELTALQSRCIRLMAEGFFPYPPKDRRAFPYPPI